MRKMIGIFLFFSLGISAAQSQHLSSDDIAEIKNFSSLEMQKGQLLTPVRGNVSRKAKNIQNLVQKIIQDLSGEELKQKNINLIVNVYANETANAWVWEIDPKETESLEGKWKTENPDQTWPIRRLHKFSNDDSIFEVAVTTGLINKIETADQLAFVLGHELSHLLEGHTHHADNGDNIFKQWWSMQSHEAVADHLGIQKMIGKYNINAAIEVMDILYQNNQESKNSNPTEAFKSAYASHHSEGLRLSMLQMHIEYLKRFNKLTQKINPIIQLDHQYKINAFHREANFLQTPQQKQQASLIIKNEVSKVVNNRIRKQLIYLDSYELRALNLSDNEMKSIEATQLMIQNNGDLIPDFILKTMIDLQSAPISKTEKNNALLRLLVYFSTRLSNGYLASGSEILFKNFNKNQTHKLVVFLGENSKGEMPWNLDSFKIFLNDFSDSQRFAVQNILLASPESLNIFEFLTDHSPNWKNIFLYISSLDSFTNEKSVDLSSLYKTLEDLARFPMTKKISSNRLNLNTPNTNKTTPTEGSLAYQAVVKLAESLNHFSNRDLLMAQTSGDGGVPELVLILSRLESFKKRYPLFKNLDVSLQQEFVKNHLADIIMTTLKNFNPVDPENSYTEAIESLEKSLNLIDFSKLHPAKRQLLESLFGKYIEISFYANNLLLNAGLRHSGDFNKSLFLILSNLILKSKNNPNLQMIYLKYFITHHSAETLTVVLNETDPHIKKANEKIKSIISNLTIKELFALQKLKSPNEFSAIKIMTDSAREHSVNSFSQLYKKFEQKGDTGSTDFEKLMPLGSHLERYHNFNKNLLSVLEKYQKNINMNLSEYKFFMQNYQHSRSQLRFSNLYFISMKNPIDEAGAKFIFNQFVQVTSETKSIFELSQLHSKIMKIIGNGFIPTGEQSELLSQIYKKHFSALPDSQKINWLEHSDVRKILGAQFVSQQLTHYAGKNSKGNIKSLQNEVKNLSQRIPLEDSWPDAYRLYQEGVAEKNNLQPHEVQVIFPQSTKSITHRAESGNTEIRMFSAFSSYTRNLPFQEQIEMIEYIMGRSNTPPKTLQNESSLGDKINIQGLFLLLREELKYRSSLDVSLLINSIFAGHNSMASDMKGLQMISDHLLKHVQPQNKVVAQSILNALYRAEGVNKSLFISYALSQRAAPGEKNILNESAVLKSLLDAYGVPGVKLAQYLAFTNEFKTFMSALESYQDSAMPISYLEALKLIQSRLGNTWDPQKYRIKGIIGSGSVNIAIEYQNLMTQKSEVLNISRDQIEVKTQEDFRRFQLLVNELVKDKKNAGQFEFISGLIEIIKKSVSLEFNKKNAFEQQNKVQALYKKSINGWNYQSIPAHEIIGQSIRMAKAPGVTSKNILKSHPQLYKEVMRGFMQIEYGVLRGVSEKGNWSPIPLHANPDIHDGQIMIDLKTKTVTLLDYGQSVDISNNERNLALDLLRIISKQESQNSTIEILKKYSKNISGLNLELSSGEISKVLSREDRMDIFVRLLALLNRKNFQVPLSTVHWVLAANRLVKLGEKINIPMESSFKWLVGMRKLGFPLATYNAAHGFKDKISNKTQLSCSQIFQ